MTHFNIWINLTEITKFFVVKMKYIYNQIP